MSARTEVQEIDPEEWSGCSDTPPRLRFRRVVVEEGHTPAQRNAIRILRRLVDRYPEARAALDDLKAKGRDLINGDELDRQPGDTRRGIPAGFTHEALCGAKTKAGHPCRAMKVQGCKRCKWHGGLSTGPRTPEGKAKCARNLRQVAPSRHSTLRAHGCE